MRKPVRKRKGYDSGGLVDRLGDQLADTHNRTLAAQGGRMTPEQSDRYVSARNAITSADYNSLSPEAQKRVDAGIAGYSGKAPGKLSSGRDSSLGRADYPGFRKGGKVKKVTPVVRKRR
jgi:hypothetical protein